MQESYVLNISTNYANFKFFKKKHLGNTYQKC